MVNKVILVGNLGNDPETKAVNEQGTKVTRFTLATSRKWKDKSGKRQEETEWHSVICWDPFATVAEKYLRKGRMVYVEGRLHTRSWEDNGQKRYRTEVVCESLQMLPSGKRDGDPSAGESSGEDEVF